MDLRPGQPLSWPSRHDICRRNIQLTRPNWFRLHTKMGSARCMPCPSRYRYGLEGSHSPSLLRRSCSYKHSRWSSYVLAGLDSFRHLSRNLRQSRVRQLLCHRMASTTWFCLRPSNSFGPRNLVLSRITSLVVEEEEG